MKNLYYKIFFCIKKVEKKLVEFTGLNDKLTTFLVFGVAVNVVVNLFLYKLSLIKNPFVIIIYGKPFNYKSIISFIFLIFSVSFFSHVKKKKGTAFQKKVFYKYNILPTLLLFLIKIEYFLTKRFIVGFFFSVFLLSTLFLIYYNGLNHYKVLKVLGLFLKSLLLVFYPLFRNLFNFSLFLKKDLHNKELLYYKKYYQLLQKKEISLNRLLLVLGTFVIICYLYKYTTLYKGLEV